MPNTIPYFFSLTGSQVIIPPGIKAFSISVPSGLAYVNGTPLPAGQKIEWQAVDKFLLGSYIAVGTTGAGNVCTVFYAA